MKRLPYHLSKSILWLFFLLLLGNTPVFSQANAKLERVKTLFYHQQYDKALSLIKATRQLNKDHKEASFLKALCHFQLNQLNESAAILSRLRANKSAYPECTLYLARIYHAQHQFAKATELYKQYLRRLRPNHEQRPMVIEEIRRCDNGIRMQYKAGKAVVENLGPKVNSAHDEFAPILSPNHLDRLYFSSLRPGNNGGLRLADGQRSDDLGHPLSDLYSCRNQAGLWGETQAMHYLLNSPQHEVLLDFSSAGSAMIFFKGNSLANGNILIDSFQRIEDRRLNSVEWQTPIEADRGDRALFVYNDTLLLFASRRAGGYGGLDIWSTSKRYGRWTSPKNLGPYINSPFDETSPYLARDGRTLYFSSNDSRRGIGGLDILKSVWLQEANRWSDAQNLGLPINSAADDADFRISRDGFTAFFASARKDGYGMRDLYAAYFQDYLPEMEVPISYSPPPPPVVKEELPTAVHISPSPTVNKPNNTTNTVEENPVLTSPRPVDSNTSVNPEPSSYRIHLPSAQFQPSKVDQQKLSGINRLLLENASMNLVITAYAPRSFSKGEALYFGLKQAEAAANYLMRMGVNADRLFMRSLTQKETDDWQLEIAFRGVGDTPFVGKLPVIGGKLPMRNINATVNQSLTYKVQVVSVKKVWQHEALKEYDYPMAETTPGFGFHRITLGAFSSFSEAEKYRRHLRSRGFNSAFTVVYLNGRRIDKNQAKRNTHLFPDLNNYLGL